MPLHTILRALRVLGCELVPADNLMEALRERYPDLWAYADVIANLMCGKNEYAEIDKIGEITEECVETFSLLVGMDGEDADTMTKHLFQSHRDRKSIITAVVGELRKERMVNPTKTYSLDVTFNNLTSDRSAPETGLLMLHGGTWCLQMKDLPKMNARGYECVTENELYGSTWILDGWRKENATITAMQTEVTFGDTKVTMFFSSIK